MQYSRETSVKELGGRALSMSCFILLLRGVAELAIRKTSFIYATDRKVKYVWGNLFTPPVSKYQRYRYTHTLED